jgi:putative sigma-54 modulation protein
MKKAQRARTGVSVQVKGKNLPVTPALRDQVVHKMNKLDKYLDRLDQIEVELSTEKTRDADHHNHVEATTHVAGRTIRVTSVHGDMYAAIDEAVDKLYRQLNRQKERMKSHHPGKTTATQPGVLEDEYGAPAAVDDGLEGSEPIVHIERLEVKPQFEEEAIAEMASSTRDFYVFLNARNEQVNVLYRREDGSYGLIEPRAG